MLFADDDTLVSHTEAGLQRLVDCLSHTCKEFRLTTSLKKTNILIQAIESPPDISINDTHLEELDSFSYLGSTKSSLSFGNEISNRIRKATAVTSKLNKRLRNSSQLTKNTKAQRYQSTRPQHPLLHDSESWQHAGLEKRLNTSHLHCLRRLLHIKWQDRVTNAEVLKRAGILSMFSLLSKRRLKWLGHGDCALNGARPHPEGHAVWRAMREMSSHEKATSSLQRLVRKNVKIFGTNTSKYKDASDNCQLWRGTVKEGVKRAEATTHVLQTDKIARMKARAASVSAQTNFICCMCSRDCHS
ncbi:uncharacterized protein [Diadema antillarum]|uniref:uncharacterized protein n=1 Tax=Diadema antillarum TaxID=105358 RepID=UPI003A8B415E